MKALYLILALALTASFSFGKKNRQIPYIFLNNDQTLHFRIIDSIIPVYEYGDEDDRFHYFEQVLTEILEEIDFPMPYKIERFGARKPHNQPQVDVFINKWGPNGLGEIEVQLNAVLRQQPDKNKLGYFKYADGAATLLTSSRRTDKYNEVLRKALVKLVSELNKRFENEFEAELDIIDSK